MSEQQQQQQQAHQHHFLRQSHAAHFREHSLAVSDLSKLQGTWFMAYSTLPIWRAETGRRNLQITYTLHAKAGTEFEAQTMMDDVVAYTGPSPFVPVIGHWVYPHDHKGAVVATDTVMDGGKWFLWRGTGMLRWMTDGWCVVAADPEFAEWIIAYFEPTVFSEEGLDVFTRSQNISPATEAQVRAAISADPVLQQIAQRLHAPARDGVHTAKVRQGEAEREKRFCTQSF